VEGEGRLLARDGILVGFIYANTPIIVISITYFIYFFLSMKRTVKGQRRGWTKLIFLLSQEKRGVDG
jgi:hypothetical protein